MDEQNPDADSRIQTICLLLLVGVALTYMVYWLRPVLMPLVVAFFVVSGVSPMLNTLEKHLGVTRLVAAGLTFLAGVVILIIFGCTVWISMLDLSSNAGAYRNRVRALVLEVEERVPFDVSLRPDAQPEVPTNQSGIDQASQFVDRFVRDGISIVTQTLVHLVSNSVVVLIFVFFLLIGTPTMQDQNATIRVVDRQVRSYLSLKTVISIFTGLAFGLALRIFGVPMAFTFGVMAFLLNFVPNVGPIVASLLPLPLIIFDPSGNVTWMVSVIAVTGAIQLISGNLVEPKIMGDAADLHPVSILLALMFWGMMWGAIGMFLATPITSALKIIFERFESTRPVADLLAGRISKESAA